MGLESLGNILSRVRGAKVAGVVVAPAPEPVCQNCVGRGWTSRHVAIDHPDFGVAFRCPCSMTLGPENFEDFDVDPYPEKYPRLVVARDAVMAWVIGEGPAMLLLGGAPGCGKTYLALAARWALARAELGHRFLEDAQLDRMIRRSFDDDSTDDLLMDLGRVDYLMLDDYGLVTRRDTMNSILDAIINDRWKGAREGRRTLVTTNKDYSDLPPRMLSRIDDATYSRTVGIVAPDYRQRQR